MEMQEGPPPYADQLRLIAALDERFRTLLAQSLGLNFTALEAMEWLMREGPLTPSELASRLQRTPGAITGVVNRLVATGHAHRDASGGDGRSVRISPEPASIHTATQLLMPLIANVSQRAAAYTEAEMEVIHRFLGDITEAYRHGIESLSGGAIAPTGG